MSATVIFPVSERRPISFTPANFSGAPHSAPFR